MNSFKKILVPFDGSQHSNDALAQATDLAHRYAASLLLIMHVDYPLTYALPKGNSRTTPEQLAQIGEDIKREVALAPREAMRDCPLEVETLVQRGDPVTEILRMAADGEFDVIVMSTHGRSGIARALLGSVTDSVVHRAPCTVLVVRSNDTRPAAARP
jgi:nucleotide-binding universal stress UspA family protein